MSDQRNGGIAWTDQTWNPIRGCSRVSAGCMNCYAESMAARFSGNGQPYEGTINPETKRWNGKIKLVPEHLQDPLRWKRPRMAFVNSMSDLFHEDVPDDFIDQVFAVMTMSPKHTFQVLTKRPERMLQYMNRNPNTKALRDLAINVRGIPMYETEAIVPWPRQNIWLGVTVENQEAADERIPLLLQTPAAVRWVSIEPLLGPVDLMATDYLTAKLGAYPFRGMPDEHRTKLLHMLDWVVVGGESGKNARPIHPDWVRSLRDQCAGAGVSFLFKQCGEWVDCDNGPADDAVYFGKPECWVDVDGKVHDGALGVDFMHGTYPMYRVGKKPSGRLLDGVLHDEYPVAKP